VTDCVYAVSADALLIVVAALAAAAAATSTTASTTEKLLASESTAVSGCAKTSTLQRASVVQR
jgi:hypothetical protein